MPSPIAMEIHKMAMRQKTGPEVRPPTLSEYMAENLQAEMRRQRGKKRIRKKKAQKALRIRYWILGMAGVLHRRVNYAEIGRKAFVVEPMPPPSGLSLYPEGEGS